MCWVSEIHDRGQVFHSGTSAVNAPSRALLKTKDSRRIRGDDSSPQVMQGRLDAYEARLPEHETAAIVGSTLFVRLDDPAALDFIRRH